MKSQENPQVPYQSGDYLLICQPGSPPQIALLRQIDPAGYRIALHTFLPGDNGRVDFDQEDKSYAIYDVPRNWVVSPNLVQIPTKVYSGEWGFLPRLPFNIRPTEIYPALDCDDSGIQLRPGTEICSQDS